jgi:squalene synthase HpnC
MIAAVVEPSEYPQRDPTHRNRPRQFAAGHGWDFAAHWRRYGQPALQEPQFVPPTLELAARYCRQVAAEHYENFSKASWLVPRGLRQDLFHIYAYCRWSDDLADEPVGEEEAIAPEAGRTQARLQRLNWWQAELDAMVAGRSARHPVMVAMADTLRRHTIDHQPLSDLLTAFRRDQLQTRYADDAELLDYCRYSAVPVGRLVLGLAGVNAPAAVALADSVCTGLQLANFCQDVAQDAARGRIYWPSSRWEAAGIGEAELLAGRVDDRFRLALADWVAYAREFLVHGWGLRQWGPGWLRRDVGLFVGGGLTILQRIAAADYDVWSNRIKLSRWDRLRVVRLAWLGGRLPGLPHATSSEAAAGQPAGQRVGRS